MPCIFSIWRNRKHSCFKLMWAMGVLDMLNLAILGSITGLFTMFGTAYCLYPEPIYCLGTIMGATFMAETLIEIILSLNRCVYFISVKWGNRYFREKDDRCWFWALPSLIYWIIYFLYGNSMRYSAFKHAWGWTPHFGYADKMNNEVRVNYF